MVAGVTGIDNNNPAGRFDAVEPVSQFVGGNPGIFVVGVIGGEVAGIITVPGEVEEDGVSGSGGGSEPVDGGKDIILGGLAVFEEADIFVRPHFGNDIIYLLGAFAAVERIFDAEVVRDADDNRPAPRRLPFGRDADGRPAGGHRQGEKDSGESGEGDFFHQEAGPLFHEPAAVVRTDGGSILNLV